MSEITNEELEADLADLDDADNPGWFRTKLEAYIEEVKRLRKLIKTPRITNEELDAIREVVEQAEAVSRWYGHVPADDLRAALGKLEELGWSSRHWRCSSADSPQGSASPTC